MKWFTEQEREENKREGSSGRRGRGRRGDTQNRRGKGMKKGVHRAGEGG